MWIRFVLPLLLAAQWIVATSVPARGEDLEHLQPLLYQNPGLEVDLGVGLWAYPMPFDYDNDGDLDLLVGCPDKPSQGTYFFENTSQDPHLKMPVFEPAVRLGDGHHYLMLSMVNEEPVILRPGKAYRRNPQTLQFDFNSPQKLQAPENPHLNSGGRIRANMWRMVDFEGDGDHDLLVGIGDWSDYGWDHAYDNLGQWRNGPLHGYVYVMLNSGSDSEPVYAEPYRLRAGGGEVDVYGWPSPNMVDFDGDGDLDLLCGEFMDGFTYFQNWGTRQEPRYAAGVKLCQADGSALVMHLQMITPTAIDWDRDGDVDMIVGDEDGRVAFVENTGRLSDATPVFESPRYFRQKADQLKCGALSTPYACDWDRDGDEDIICGNTAGNISWFENLGLGENGKPRWAEARLLNVETQGGEHLPFRVMAGSDGSIQGPCEAKWGYTTLSVADLNRDGKPDIVYNSILGRLGKLLQKDHDLVVEADFDSGLLEAPPVWSWWQRESPTSLTQWRTTPVVIDFDGDQQLDLVMLDQQGFLTLRRGFGQAERIFLDEKGDQLRLTSTSCGSSGRIKLAVVDWDGDGRLDVLTNSENARWYRNCQEVDSRIVMKNVGNLARRNVAGHTSSPAICDFNNDGKPDLLVGSENGRLYHIEHDQCVSYSEEETRVKTNNDFLKEVPLKTIEQAIVTSEMISRQPPTEFSHASTICQSSRGLVAAWAGGTKSRAEDVGIWTSYHDGSKWTGPIEVADGRQHAGLRYPCWNPVLFQPPGDGPTLLFFKVGPSPDAWWGEMMISYDRGRSFGHRRRLPEGIIGPVRNKPILLSDGQTLLCGSSQEQDRWLTSMQTVSLDDGHVGSQWKVVGPIDESGNWNVIQPTFLSPGGTSLQMLCRTREGMIVTSFSSDNAESWSAYTSTGILNPNSAIDAITLKDGRHLLVYNDVDQAEADKGLRHTLSVAISTDGNQWEKALTLDDTPDNEFSYPAVIQSDSGDVHITYSWNKTRIKHVVIDPEHLSGTVNVITMEPTP